MSLNRPGLPDASWHAERAGNYRRFARLLLEVETDSYAAGALLYEAAKQCINAVANQLGENPGTTAAKIRLLRGIAENEPQTSYLLQNWRNANALHIHADRGFLADSEYVESWNNTQSFIDQMLLICAQNQ